MPSRNLKLWFPFLSGDAPILRWPVSGVVFGLLYPLAWGFVALANYPAAYFIFVVFGLFSLLVWFTSDWAYDHGKLIRSLSAVVTAGLFCAVVFSIWYSHAIKAKNERDDADQRLICLHEVEPGSQGDPIPHTMFSVVNNSSQNISSSLLFCNTNLAVGNGGMSSFRGPSFSPPGKVSKKNMMGLGGGLFTTLIPPDFGALRSGGDGVSEPCLAAYDFEETDCVDVTVVFRYFLQTQRDNEEKKSFRLLARKSNSGGFSWYTESLDHKGSYCESYLAPLQLPLG